MPTIPQYQPGQVSVNPLPNVAPRNPTNEQTYGSGIGQAVQQAGTQIASPLIQIQKQEKRKADDAALFGASTQLAKTQYGLFNDPSTGAFAKTGKDAFGLPEQVWPKWDAQVDEISNGLSLENRQRFRQMAETRREALQGQLANHVVRQSDAYYGDQLKASTSTSLNLAVANYTNDHAIGLEIANTRGAIGTYMESQGAPTEAIDLAENEAVSGIHRAVIAKWSIDDPTKAQDYYARYGSEMTEADKLIVQKALKPVNDRQAGSDIATHMWAKGQIAASTDALWSGVKTQESGGQQFGVDGQALTSTKGAIGVSQIMPNTAKAAAARLGVPYSEGRLRTDPLYNETLGREELSYQLKRYDANPVLALAAYNAGSGAVDKWVKDIGDPRTGEISNADFINRIPYKETREYVAAITSKTGTGEQLPDLSSMAAQIDKIPDEGIRQQAAAEFSSLQSRHQMQERQIDDQFTQSINSKIEQSPPGTSAASVMTPSELDWAQRNGKLAAWEARQKARASGEQQVTPLDVQLSLSDTMRRAALGDTTAQAEVMKMQPYDPSLQWAPSDRDKVSKFQQALAKGDSNETMKAATEGEISSTIQEYMVRDLGIDPKVLKGPHDPDSSKGRQAAQATQFNAQMRTWASQFQQQSKRAPTYTEVRDHADELVLSGQVTTTKPGWFGTTSETTTPFKISDLQIPPYQLQQITDALHAKGQPVTANNIAAYYRAAAKAQ